MRVPRAASSWFSLCKQRIASDIEAAGAEALRRFLRVPAQTLPLPRTSSTRFMNRAVTFAALALACGLAVAEDERPVNPFEGKQDIVPEGNSLFNQYCSHCHGPNAVQGERPRDLRRLTIRYGNDAIVVFYKTVNNGRMEKGMPVWKGVLGDDALWKIFTFLSSVQTQP